MGDIICKFEERGFKMAAMKFLSASEELLKNHLNKPKIWQKMKKSLVPTPETQAQCSKIGKKCNLKSAKKHYLHFQKWQKINFCTRKKFKTTKNPVFFSVRKLHALLVVLNFFCCKFWFFASFENANNAFLHFWNCTFSQF